MSVNTIATNQQLNRFDGHAEVWLFGYGSLIWKADFPFLEKKPASIRGWSRRFWQGSHDHRGTAELPGRVATLIADPDARCAGMAYRISPTVFDHLDEREKNGYLREIVQIEFACGDMVEGLIYIAGPDNQAFLGHASDSEIAAQIARARGPSGFNREYLMHLAEALRNMDVHDAHVFAIERQLELIDANPLSH